jgi:transcriptional regulator with XRE-family HTH domain
MSEKFLKHWKAAGTKARMKALLVLLGWSLEDLAKETGLTKQAWSKAFSPKTRLTPTQIVKFRTAVNVSFDDLICAEDFSEGN